MWGRPILSVLISLKRCAAGFSAAFTAFALVLVPFLRLGDKRADDWPSLNWPAAGPRIS